MAFIVGFRKFGEMKFSKTLVKSFSTANIFLSKKGVKKFNNEIIIRNIDEKEENPLMVIVGWSNSNNRHLAKYSALYEKHGLTTISVSCKMYRFAMFYDSLFADDTKACIDALESQCQLNKERKVFFKLFSTPGPAMYVNIMNYYYQYIQGHFGTDRYKKREEEYVPKICGVVFDSPTVASGNAQQFANGMKGDSKNPLSNFMFDILGQMIYAYAVRNSKMHKFGPEFFRNIPVLIPQLILYSKADKIAGYEAIGDYIEHQKSVGTAIDFRMWENSPHVLHYRHFPEEYEELVKSFVSDCLVSSDLSRIPPVAESKDYDGSNRSDVVKEIAFSQKDGL